MASVLESWAAFAVVDFVKTLIVIHAIISVALYAAILLFGEKMKLKRSLSIGNSSRPLLLITAHPDDECMFFSPFLLSVDEVDVHVLCLTNGNFYGQGKVREKEIIRSCQILGVAADHVSVINNSRFPDDPKALWDTSALESQLFAAVNRIQPQHIVTFDDYGVSGHPNHIAVSNAVRNIFQDGDNFKGVESVYYLQSVGVLRKYLGLLDLPFTYLSAAHVCLLSPAHIVRAQRAMVAHWSQLEWFRVVYIALSRYMAFNTFTQQYRPLHWPSES